MTHDEAKQQLETVLKQYRNGLITESERADQILTILYAVLYPEQF